MTRRLALLLAFTAVAAGPVVPVSEVDVEALPTVRAIEAIKPSLAAVEIIETRYGVSLFGDFTRTIGVTGYSGFVVSPDGYVVTSATNVENARTVALRIDGERWPAEIIDVDPFTDVALLKVVGDAPLFTPAKFADSDSLRPGMPVLAVGYPLGESQAASMGVVSALRDYFLPSGYLIPSMIQTDAHNYSFNRGGPLIDMDGRVIGLTSFSVQENLGTPVYLITSVLDLNFAVPGNVIWETAQNMMQGSEIFHPWIGCHVRPMAEHHAIFLGMPEELLDEGVGVLVENVDLNSPCAQHGIDRGDAIIGFRRLRVDQVTGAETTDEAWIRTPLDLAGQVRRSRPEDTLTIVLLRPGGVLPEISFRPVERPEDAALGTI